MPTPSQDAASSPSSRGATVTIAIPPSLRDLIAEQADTARQTQDAVADAALGRQIAVAEAARLAGECLAERYLTDPRMTTIGASTPTIHISAAANTGAADLAEVMSGEVGKNVPKGRVIQALLWAELAPLPPDAQRLPLPEPPTLDTFTLSVPPGLNAALLDLALRRASSREAVIEDLLARGFEELAETPEILVPLQSEARVQAAERGGKTTIHVPRVFDAPLKRLGGESFGGVKSYALQALLWRGLDRARDEPAAELSDRPVMLSGRVYTRVARHLIARYEQQGDSISLKEFVEGALEDRLDREQGQKPQGRAKANGKKKARS